MSSEYSRTRGAVNKRGRGKARGGVVNRRSRRKARAVSPVMGKIGCPGCESDCLKSAETGVGVSARTYDSNSLGDRTSRCPLSYKPCEHRKTESSLILSCGVHRAYSQVDIGYNYHNEVPQMGTHRPCRLHVLEHQPYLFLLLRGIFTSQIPSGIFVDWWRSQSRGRAATLPLPCKVCILSKMSQSWRIVCLVWPPCVPGCLKSNITRWWEGFFCTPTQSLTPPDGCSMYNQELNLEPSL